MDAYEAIAADAAALVPSRQPVLLGISGGVGVGKSTTATLVGDHLAARGVGCEIVGTDAFLLPNTELDHLELSMRKGFPESFDVDALETFLRAVRAQATDITVPVYSHETYDRVPGATRTVKAADVVIVEGVNALQPPVVDHLDIAVYVDAAEEDMAAWFIERFLALCRAALDDERSFYRGFTGMSEEQQRGIAEWTWREINLVNLRDHIAPSKARATVVLEKRRDHSVRS